MGSGQQDQEEEEEEQQEQEQGNTGTNNSDKRAVIRAGSLHHAVTQVCQGRHIFIFVPIQQLHMNKL